MILYQSHHTERNVPFIQHKTSGSIAVAHQITVKTFSKFVSKSATWFFIDTSPISLFISIRTQVIRIKILIVFCVFCMKQRNFVARKENTSVNEMYRGRDESDRGWAPKKPHKIGFSALVTRALVIGWTMCSNCMWFPKSLSLRPEATNNCGWLRQYIQLALLIDLLLHSKYLQHDGFKLQMINAAFFAA